MYLFRIFYRTFSVHISMDTFMKKYRKDEYKEWLAGTAMGRHPENPLADEMPVPKPYYQDYLVNKKYVTLDLFRHLKHSGHFISMYIIM